MTVEREVVLVVAALYTEQRREKLRGSKVFFNVFGLTDVEGKIVEIIEHV
jgi:hypothetical protein